MSTEPRYLIVRAHPEGDALGDSDRLIVDREQDTVVAIVYGTELADLAGSAFELHRDWGETKHLELGPTTGRVHPDTHEDIRPLHVDLSHGGYVAFHRDGEDYEVRIIRHEVQALLTALTGWTIRTA